MTLKVVLFFGIYLVAKISGHGMMLNPPGRSSFWRFNKTAPINYNDNQAFCGGAYVQNELNGGKCGVCGDPYTDPHPQKNENTGFYGTGIVVKTYEPGSVIDVEIKITANHLGNFKYSLCELKDFDAPEPNNCFEDLLLEDGSDKYIVNGEDNTVFNKVRLPNLQCERCVLRWTYKAGQHLCNFKWCVIVPAPNSCNFRPCLFLKLR
ncbi:uncharacterized protein LOC126890433 isoform X2 [Diabrotica virgifera virgifera]|uniref:Chitin-binding type-4 domain-containing protein n=1 Tax=Diabrotica virgifera virgifera TaxID=50390 RepID=A0ABM5KYP6_DIAVI|nr:uncharacterized protein LOC126890433 isoform X2 [Diabrotica virgifera virgifera]